MADELLERRNISGFIVKRPLLPSSFGLFQAMLF